MDPATVPNLPATHAVQLLVPVARLLYVPAVHEVHTMEVAPEATSLYWPALHAVHPLVPVANALYVPTAHCAQALPPPDAP